ncbi:hypothetical protein ES703_112597 [subsurface metagenome]
MEYYIYMIDEIEGSLRRVDMNSSPVVLERWDDGKWIFSPETIAVTGLGSDADNYKKITKREAEKYIKKRSRSE